MPDKVGWILPPRCATRYTMGLMWKYGVQELSYHHMDPTVDVDIILMNIRNPYTRIRSWLRLWNTTLEEPISSYDYIMNLHTREFQAPQFVAVIEDPNGLKHPWKYPIPLTAYKNSLKSANRKVDFYIRQEHLEQDLEDAGYPVQDYVFIDNQRYKQIPVEDSDKPNEIRIGFVSRDTDQIWEQGDGQSDLDFYQENPICAEIVALYYAQDFQEFEYSFEIEDLKS